MPAPEPIAVSSQFATVKLTDEGDPSTWSDEINRVVGLICDDVQRLAQRPMESVTMTSGSYRAVAETAGIARVWAISDTATAGSTGVDYHTLAITRNGVAPVTTTYDTRRTEIPRYLGGVYLGEITVSQGDVLAVSVTVGGAPAPTLTTANFSLLYTLRGG